MRVSRMLLSFAVVTTLTGCSTVATHSVDSSQLGPYSGTQQAFRNMKRSTSDFTLAGETWFHAADVPLSFVADTLLLPYDIFTTMPERQADDGGEGKAE